MMARLQLLESDNSSHINSNCVSIGKANQQAPQAFTNASHPNKENIDSRLSRTSVNKSRIQINGQEPAISATKHSQLDSEMAHPTPSTNDSLVPFFDEVSGPDRNVDNPEHEFETMKRKRRRSWTQRGGSLGTMYFDPYQGTDERRRIRKGLRDLNKEAQDSRNEWLAPDSNGIQDIVVRANEYFDSVKQTSDATIDSRLLVTAGDLTYRKTSQIVLGESVRSIDVDEFVSKFITFMRSSNNREAAEHGHQARRQRHSEQDSDDEGDPDVGDALGWEWLGAHACFPRNSRPPVPGFLLGPLSLQKRSRPPRIRREKLQRATLVEAARPDELQFIDLANTESSDVKGICTRIHHQLTNLIITGQNKVQEQFHDDISDEDYHRLLAGNHLASNGGVPLFDFVLHPTSFGQTVENLFYVSFLIKDGAIGIESDDTGLPVLHIPSDSHEQNAMPSQQESAANVVKTVKHQAVLRLDYETWKDLVNLLQIDRCLIPDRAEGEATTQVGMSQWYG